MLFTWKCDSIDIPHFIGSKSDYIFCIPLSLTESLTNLYLVDLIDVSLAGDDDSSKYVDVIVVVVVNVVVVVVVVIVVILSDTLFNASVTSVFRCL